MSKQKIAYEEMDITDLGILYRKAQRNHNYKKAIELNQATFNIIFKEYTTRINSDNERAIKCSESVLELLTLELLEFIDRGIKREQIKW